MITQRKKDETPLTGEQIMDAAVAEPTIDTYLDHSPKLLTERNYVEMVAILQRKRAMFITAEQKKREPKQDGEDNGEVNTRD